MAACGNLWQIGARKLAACGGLWQINKSPIQEDNKILDFSTLAPRSLIPAAWVPGGYDSSISAAWLPGLAGLMSSAGPCFASWDLERDGCSRLGSGVSPARRSGEAGGYILYIYIHILMYTKYTNHTPKITSLKTCSRNYISRRPSAYGVTVFFSINQLFCGEVFVSAVPMCQHLFFVCFCFDRICIAIANIYAGSLEL